jgi:protein TonB
MPCLNIRHLQAYLEDSVDPGLRQRLEHHLVECDRCRGRFDKLAATNHRVDTWLAALASPMDHAALDVAAAMARIMGGEEAAVVAAGTTDDHLDRLLAPAGAEIPWYQSLYRNLRDLVKPEKLPPLQVTSRPVPVRDIWGLYANDPKNRLISVGIHVAVFSMVLLGVTSPQVRMAVKQKFDLIDPNLKPYLPDARPRTMQGGGGGGAREPLPVSQGRLPHSSMKQFVPPMIVDHTPKLAMDPSLLAPPDTVLPQSTLNNWGDPLARLVNGSSGNGSGGGMGNGSGGGVGSGNGNGYGPGSGGGVGGGVFRVGGGVSAPEVLFKVDPEYSEEARKAKYSGAVLLAVVVDAEGRARDIHVVKSLGMGLDEKAIEAVQKWKFRPGMKGGVAVNVRAQIEVNFRLL